MYMQIREGRKHRAMQLQDSVSNTPDSLPVGGPAVLLEELLAGLLEVKVGPQVGRVQWLAGEGVLGLAAQVLGDGGALVGLACFCLRRG